jgi:hypothetical protein
VELKRFFFLFGFFLLLRSIPALADVPFEDNFNSYNTGQLRNQGGWTAGYNTCFNVIDVGGGDKEAICNQQNNTILYKYGDTSSYGGEWSFDFYIPSCNLGSGGYAGRFWFLSNTGDELGFLGYFNYPADPCRLEVNVSGIYVNNILQAGWQTIIFEYEVGGQNRFRFKVPGKNYVSSWFNFPVSNKPVKGLSLRPDYGSSVSNIKIDDIKEYVLVPATGTEPILELTKPTICQWNYNQNFSNLEFKGKIKNPSSSNIKWTRIVFEFTDLSPDGNLKRETRYKIINPGEYFSFDYFFNIGTTSLDIWLPEIYIYGQSYQATTTQYYIHKFNLQSENCLTRLTSSSTEPSYFPGIVNVEVPSTTEWWQPEDCNQYSGITDKLLCGIKNLIGGIVLPDRGKILQFYNEKDILFKQKFPFNLLKTIKDFFSDVYNGVSEGKITLGMFHSTTTFNVNFYQNLPIISQVFSAVKLVFNILLLYFGVKVIRKESDFFISHIIKK